MAVLNPIKNNEVKNHYNKMNQQLLKLFILQTAVQGSQSIIFDEVFFNKFSTILLFQVNGSKCTSGESLAVYELEVETFWSEELFPKQYPQWRPPPQWSRTLGILTDGATSLYTEGKCIDVWNE